LGIAGSYKSPIENGIKIKTASNYSSEAVS
jgi:hypothetical protein